MKKLFLLQLVASLFMIGCKSQHSLKYTAVLIPETKNIISGQQYKAKVVVVAEDTANNIKGNVSVKSDVGSYMFTMDSGASNIKFPSYNKGTKKVSGNVECRINGQTLSLPFADSFFVDWSMAAIYPDNMYLLYSGIDNPISIIVPGVPDEDVVVTITYGEVIKRKGRRYIVKVSQVGETVISVSMRVHDSSLRSCGALKLKVRKLPVPSSQMDTLLSGGTETIATIKQNATAIYASLGEGFPIEGIKYTVNKFTITVAYKDNKGMESLEVTGDKLNDKATELINKIKPGDKIIIDNISITGPDGERTASPFIVTAK